VLKQAFAAFLVVMGAFILYKNRASLRPAPAVTSGAAVAAPAR